MFYKTIGVFSADLLAYQVSMICPANWPRQHYIYIYIYVWIYENEAKGLKSLTKRASFFSRQKLSPKGTI